MFQWDHLEAIAEQKRAEWDAAAPTHFFVIDGLLQPDVCDELGDFSSVAGKVRSVRKVGHKHVRGKSGLPRPTQMDAVHRRFFEEVNSDRFVNLIQRMTGIEPIYADPTLNGGGLHQIRRGGYLNVHTDFNFEPETKRNRRLNLLLYLNKEWKDEWNGQIELWTTDLDRPFFSVAPIMNRALLFETSETSYHGHPVPLNAPPGVYRKSLAVYYYSDWPAGVEPRSATGYQLTRAQWAGLISKVAQIVSTQQASEDDVVDALQIDYQTGDIRIAYNTLYSLRSAPLIKEEYWEYPNGEIATSPPERVG